jgi:hypothetical protein
VQILEAPCVTRGLGEETMARIVTVIRGEFVEMPGLRLTRPQFRRLWNLTIEQQEPVLDCLIQSGFLVEGPDGFLRRRSDARR